MSVLASKRTESKYESIVYATEIHNMLREFMQRNFGIRDMNNFVRRRYEYYGENADCFTKYRYLMTTHKKQIDHLAALLTNNVRAANSIYPRTYSEWETRRNHLTNAIVNCEQIIKELQQVIEDFEVDINAFKQYNYAINREIELIKKWRQRDNDLLKYVKKGNI